MQKYRTWLDMGNITAERARRALPILVRQAHSRTPITYKALSRELEMKHHRPVAIVAGYAGLTVKSLADEKTWTMPPPPPLQALVINGDDLFPGDGIDSFMTEAYRQAKTRRQKEAALNGVYSEIFSYPYWKNVLDFLHIAPAENHFDALVAEAVETKGRGGEGPEHAALKQYIASRPEILGLARTRVQVKPEFKIASGDRVGIVFEFSNLKVAVEIKSHISSVGDIARGFFQCVKYREILKVQSDLSNNPYDVDTILALGSKLPPKLIPLKNALGINVIDDLGKH